MARLSVLATLAALLCAAVVNAAATSPAGPHIIRSSKEVPAGQHNSADRIHTVDVTGHQIDSTVHEEIPEASSAPDTDDTVDITERMEQGVSGRAADQGHHGSLESITVDELKTSPASLASIPSAKTKLPTSDRVVYGTFIGYARYGTRCYRLRSYVIHARYTPYRGYYCRGRIYYFRNYICVRPVCLARIYYWRY